MKILLLLLLLNKIFYSIRSTNIGGLNQLLLLLLFTIRSRVYQSFYAPSSSGIPMTLSVENFFGSMLKLKERLFSPELLMLLLLVVNY